MKKIAVDSGLLVGVAAALMAWVAASSRLMGKMISLKPSARDDVLYDHLPGSMRDPHLRPLSPKPSYFGIHDHSTAALGNVRRKSPGHCPVVHNGRMGRVQGCDTYGMRLYLGDLVTSEIPQTDHLVEFGTLLDVLQTVQFLVAARDHQLSALGDLNLLILTELAK